MVADRLVIETIDLRKHYADAEALRGLNLQVPAGSIYGFLGRNGAGKTTTIKTLLGMTRPTSGEVRVFGLRPDSPDAGVEIRRRTGFVGEDKELYEHLTVEAMIRFTAGFYPRWRKDLEERYLRSFDLPAGRPIKALSRGMRTKLALLLAFSRGAELLILDEPTSGLDPAVSEEVLQTIIRHVATEQMTIFFSSHQIPEIEQIADRVAIVHKGKTEVEGLLDDIRERYCHVRVLFDGEAPDVTVRAKGVVKTRRQGRMLSVLSSAGAGPVLEEARTWNPVSTEVVPATLKEIFLETVSAED
jgi:ABC-2 type transport system ATP-binding protein